MPVTKVLMVDAACSTMPYDHSLCEALARKGLVVEFCGSRYVHTEWSLPATYNRRDHFYNFTDWIYRSKARGSLRRYVKAVEHVLGMIGFVRLVKKLRPDVVHFQWSQIPSIDRWFLSRLRRIAPLVYTVHNSTPLHGERPRLHRVQLGGYGHFLDHFDAYIGHTNYTRDTLVKTAQIPTSKIEVIPHGLLDYYLNLDGASDIPPRYVTSDDEQSLLFFGNISPYKGLDVLVRAMAMLPPQLLQRSRLHVVGRPVAPIKPVQNLAKSLGVDHRIAWDLRFVAEEEVPRIFNATSCVVMPYRHIDQSSVLLTGILFGKPIIASNIGGFAETLQDGVHGRLVAPEDPAALAAALAEVLSDKESLERMGQAVRRLAHQWPSWDTIAEKTIGVYEEARERWSKRQS